MVDVQDIIYTTLANYLTVTFITLHLYVPIFSADAATNVVSQINQE